jgi:hypothetical protein
MGSSYAGWTAGICSCPFDRGSAMFLGALGKKQIDECLIGDADFCRQVFEILDGLVFNTYGDGFLEIGSVRIFYRVAEIV